MDEQNAKMIAEVKAELKDLRKVMEIAHDRWMDERGYEDFGAYQTAVQKTVPDGWTFISLTKSPFAVKVEKGGKVWKITVNSRQIAYALIA